MAKFIANNNNFVSTRLFQFFISIGLYLCMNFNIINFSDTTACEQINIIKAIDIFEVI